MTDYTKFTDISTINESFAYSGSQVKVECPENVEMGGKIASLTFCTAPTWKKVVRYLLYVCTGFVLYLFILWFPKLKILLTYVESSEHNADWIIVYGADGNIDMVRLTEEETCEKRLKVFSYRLFKYLFDEENRVFRAAQYNIGSLTCNGIHNQLGNGLNEASVVDNGVLYGKNLTDIPRKPCIKVLFEEILSPFYLFQVYSFIVWGIDDYMAYAIVICVFSAISITFSLIETLRITNKLRQMSYYETPVNVFRVSNGELKKQNVSSSELVPGDLLEIPEKVIMPCDAILLNGTCIMNEAMLTGESIPVVKNSLPHNDNPYNVKEDKQYTLFAGTKCIQARFTKGNAALGLVTLTGFATVKGELIRTMLFPKPSDFKFYNDSFKFILILAIMALAGFFIDLPTFIRGANTFGSTMIQEIIIKTSEMVTITVPPALPICMQIGISVALSRLKKKQTYCISPNKINEAGRVNVMCFDKTGTLTEEGLDFLGVRPVYFDNLRQNLSFAKLVKDPLKLAFNVDETDRNKALNNYIALEREGLYTKTRMFPSEQLLEIMASCHSLIFVDNEMIGDPLDIKMFEATKWIFEENDQNKYDSTVTAVARTHDPKIDKDFEFEGYATQRAVGVIRRFEFSSKLQRMSCIVRDLKEAEFRLHLKGSPEKVRELCHPNTVPNNFHSVLEKYTKDGYRVLACGSKTLGTDYKSVMTAKREDLEHDFNFIGFLIMENKLKPVTTSIIDMLHKAEVKTIMVTGDNVLTAISVARQCHIVGRNQRTFLGDLSEKKINGKNVLTWKDFEFSRNKLNDDLEPDLDYSQERLNAPDNFIDSPIMKATAQSTFADDEIFVLEESENLSPTIREQNLNFSIVDLDPPFFNLRDQENYCVAVTGKAFSFILREVEETNNPKYVHILTKLLRKSAVFARMHPDEKALMVKHMMSDKKNTVGMCGDGANDVGALKTANVGISLSGDEASIAAPFSSKIQDISCIPRLLREGRSALSISYQTFKYMALYSVIQFTSVTILYDHLIELTNWNYYHIDMFIILPLSATMAMSGTYEHLTKFQPTGRLISVQILSSVIGQGVIQICFQLLCWNLLVRQDWFVPYTAGFYNQPVVAENSTVYLISIYQYCTVALAFLVGKPFRKAFYTNYYFTVILILEYLACLCVTFNPFDWQFFYNHFWAAEIKMPSAWCREIFILAAINFCVTLIWERVIVKYVSLKWKQHRVNKEKAKAEQDSRFSPDGSFIAPESLDHSHYTPGDHMPEISLIKHEAL